LQNYKKNGTPFINYLSLTPIRDESDQLTHYVGIQSDITELVKRKQAEVIARNEATAASAATEAKSEFLARMSHEIRTPLNGMIAVGQLLAETDLTPQQWDLVNTIQCSGEALLTLITDILDFSKIEANKMELRSSYFYLMSTVEAAMEIAGMHAAQKRLHIAYMIDDSVPQLISGDPHRLQQILLNILNNAVKFTDDGEVFLEISAKPFAEDAAMGKTFPQNDNGASIHFRVRDTGIGIAKKDLDRLFRSFSQLDTTTTRKFGGSGLGLIISQKLCEAMGGQMWAYSDGIGTGSTFRWHIKSSNATPMPQKLPMNPYIPKPATTSGKRILLVEESDMVRNIVKSSLLKWGCRVHATASEDEAIKSLKLIKNESSHHNGKKSTLSRNPIVQVTSTEEKHMQGPFDVVIMSAAHRKLLTKLMNERHTEEADRCIFLSWPGHVNLTEVDGEHEPKPLLQQSVEHQKPCSFSTRKGSFAEKLESMTTNSLGYVTVSRPVRQGRLHMALIEVLELDIDSISCETQPPTDKTCAISQGKGHPLSSRSEHESELLLSRGSSSSLFQAPVRKIGSSSSLADCIENDFEKNIEKKLLIAEDNIINMKVAMGILKRLGFSDIDTAQDGQEAIDKVQHAGGPSAYFAILMDLHMPKLGGIDAVREIKKQFPDQHTKIVAVTADAFEDTRDMCIANGFTGWLAKPFRVEEFARVMSSE